ncbi:hypothetical protein DdX_20780 [Ditylenchus destructor]|uniref:Uncharacterized protein n=1 Tax=Ditylenchus destructor TaxID=166010 RepID=A0AAD4MGL0_9BILA|nr:hypothetical protein DdX_20780 [Ditylenchus destructor]
MGTASCKLGAADLEDVLELQRLGLEGAAQRSHRFEQPADGEPQCQAHRGGVHVVGALRGVDVVVGVEHVVARLLVAQLFQREVADDLVGIHVGRGACAALDHVDHELVEQLALDDVVAGQDDGRGAVAVDGAEVGVGAGGGLLHVGQRAHQVGHGRDAGAGDGEVLDRARRVHAPVGDGGDLLLAEEVVFRPEVGAHLRFLGLKKSTRRARAVGWDRDSEKQPRL